jgi:hypothetical protein
MVWRDRLVESSQKAISGDSSHAISLRDSMVYRCEENHSWDCKVNGAP